MKKFLAILLAILVLSTTSVVAFAATVKCPKCGESITSTDESVLSDLFEQHIASCQKVQCGYCGEYQQNETALAKHEKACEKNPANAAVYECSICGEVFDSSADRQAHKEAEHSVDSLQCPYCKYQASSKPDFNNHITANHADKDGAKTTVWDSIQRQFDKYIMGIGQNTADNSFSSIVRVFSYLVEVAMSVFTESGAAGIFTDAGASGVAYFFETIIPAIFGNIFA